MLFPLAFVILGIAMLYLGGEALVRGSVAIAKHARVPTAIIGLTIVSIGTSLPEFAVSLLAALEGNPDVGMGNIVGSNIFNVGMIAGIAAIVMPITVRSETVKLEWPFMFTASVLVLVLVHNDLGIDRLEGGFLVLVLFVFLAYVVRTAMREDNRPVDVPSPGRLGIGMASVFVIGGIAILTGGGQVLVTGAVQLAELAGVSERVIGLTVVAMGTSLPELAASIVAAAKREGELALGNIIGSNIFNIVGILGAVAFIRPITVNPSIAGNDMIWMIAFSAVLFPMMFTRRVVGRAEGVLLLTGFVAYVVNVFV